MSTEYELKQHLHKIIDEAFDNDEKRSRYTDFKLVLRDEEMRASTGTYDPSTRTIEITNLNDKEANNLCTLLHELSHHIEVCQTGKTGHQKSFYAIYARLIYAALDLGRISLNDFQQMEHRNSDYRKVQKILKEYVPKARISENKCLVSVVNAYAYKEALKQRGYFWDGLNKAWTRTIPLEAVNGEKEQLRALGITDNNILMNDASAMRMTKGGHALRVYGAYEIREELKQRGYHWDGERKCWYRQMNKEDVPSETQVLLSFGNVKTEYV